MVVVDVEEGVCENSAPNGVLIFAVWSYECCDGIKLAGFDQRFVIGFLYDHGIFIYLPYPLRSGVGRRNHHAVISHGGYGALIGRGETP